MHTVGYDGSQLARVVVVGLYVVAEVYRIALLVVLCVMK
jgi:hypothetical protein